MNIAIFASAFHPHIGGVEELVRQLANTYRAKGHPTLVITNRWPRSLPAYEEVEGTPVYRLPMRVPVPDTSLKARVSYLLTHAPIRQELLSILRKHQSEALHIQCISSTGRYAVHAKRALDLPLIVTTQGERMKDPTPLFEGSRVMSEILRETLREADFITACSRDTLQDMECWYGQPFGERARPVPNGINLADFESAAPYAHPKPYILGLGRLIPKKGYDILIRAFAQAGVTDHDLLIAGDGAERTALEELSARCGMQERVHFLGFADRPKTVALFQGCAFFVLPSRIEPQGIVNLEAMAAGKAVLASHVGGVPEIVQDGETGLLVPKEDEKALAAGLARLAADRNLREALGQAGRRRAAEFDWSAIAEEYLAIYRAALGRPLP
jgi:glycogen(starch) synthase